MSIYQLQGALAAPASIAAIQAAAKARMEGAFPISQEGSTVVADNSATPHARRLVTLASIVADSTELSAEQARTVSMAEVFNTWYRFSHQRGTAAQPAQPSELTSWAYDAPSDTIRSTLNSASVLGFVSRKKYDTYTLQVEVSSTDADDDDIGLVIAFAKDPVTGYESKLVANRSPGGNSKAWSVIRNYQQDTGERVLFNSDQIAWGNGGYGLTPAASGYVANTAGQGWGALGPCRIRIVRTGDLIVVSTSEFGAGYQSYKPAADFTIDLTSNPDLALFRGPRAYGYMAESQASATFKTLEFTGDQRTIIDLANSKIWTQNTDKSWAAGPVLTGAQLIAAIGSGRIFHNPVTGKTYATAPTTVFRIM